MLTALQGQIQGNSIVLDDLKRCNGRMVTIIVNEPFAADSIQAGTDNALPKRIADKLALIESDSLVIPTGINTDDYVKGLREKDRI